MEKQIKSKKRVADHGEVFTAEREVNAMLDLVKQETERVDSRFLEPACGDGNFLAEILRRKLKEVRRKYKRSPFDYEKNAVLAVSSIYGVDLMMDNVLACRERLFGIWDKEYKAVCKKETNDQTREAVRFILSRNIVCGNALTMMCVDDTQQDTEEFIVFPEWSFPFNDARIQRRDFRLDVLLKENEDEQHYDTQFNLFGDDAMDIDKWMIDPVTNELVPKPICVHPIIPYRRLHENG
jgi:hypothetical protein